VRRRSRAWRYGFILAVLLMTLCAAGAVGVIIDYIKGLPPVEQLENFTPPEVTRVYDRNGAQIIGEFHKQDERGGIERRLVVPIRQIPKRLQHAVIAIEDRRFTKHFGVDPIGTLRAAYRTYVLKQHMEGGSTLTQQLARRVIPEVGHERTIRRKIREWIHTFRIEMHYSKDQILEFYLNQMDFGKGAFGVWAAADRYFGKDLNQLTVGECAMIAGILKGPTDYNPIGNYDRALARRDVVLLQMRKESFIKEPEYQAALKEPLIVRGRNRNAGGLYPYFLSGLGLDLKNYYNLGAAQLSKSGLRITSTIDPQIQDICTKALREGLAKYETAMWLPKIEARHAKEMEKWDGKLKPGDNKLFQIVKIDDDGVKVELERYHATIALPQQLPYYNPEKCFKKGGWLDVRVEAVEGSEVKGRFAFNKPIQGSLVVLDARTGEVLAMVGGTQGDFNYAMMGGRQVGSTFKPFFYAAAFERGHTPNEILLDEPIEFPGNPPYRPKNYGHEGTIGPITMMQAIEESRNVATIRMVDGLGLNKMLEIVKRFDFTYNQSRWRLDPRKVGISVCLGTIDCTAFEMAAAYQVFANQGVAVRPRFFRSILDAEGHMLFPKPEREEQIINPVAAYQILYCLRQVVVQPDATAYFTIGKAFNSKSTPMICGKTGTTDKAMDAWFCGLTPDLVIVCQVGCDPPISMGPGNTGGQVAGPIWIDAYSQILKLPGRNWKKSFDAPEGIELANICAVTGKRESALCGSSDHKIYQNVPFAVGKAPREMCDGSHLAPMIPPAGSGVGMAQPSTAAPSGEEDDTAE